MGVYENVDGKLVLRSGSTLYADAPIGAIQAFGGANAPSGWFICDGSAKSRTDFAELFAVIGTAFGAGDGSTTFNLPDLREAVPKGAGLTGKSNNHYDSDGLALGEFIDDRVQTHQHKLGSHDGTVDGYWATNQDGSSLTSSDLRVGGPTADNPRIYATSIVSGRSGATTEVKAVGVNYIIKAKQTALPVDLASEVAEKMQWKLLGTYTGKNAIALPSGWKEVQIIGMAHDSRDRNDICMEIFFHASALTELSQTEMKISSSRFRPSEQQGIQYTFTASTVTLDYLIYQNGTDVGAESKSVVYYK